jgi:hypothetical protein
VFLFAGISVGTTLAFLSKHQRNRPFIWRSENQHNEPLFAASSVDDRPFYGLLAERRPNLPFRDGSRDSDRIVIDRERSGNDKGLMW